MVNSCLSRLVRQQAEKYGDKVALKYRDYTTATWIPVTWNGFADLVDKTARAFVKLGVEVQENVGVFSQNKPECLYVDFGAFKDRIVTVPLYATSSEAQVHYIVEDAGIRFLFVGEQYQYDVAYRVQGLCRSLKKIIIFDPEVKRAEGDNNPKATTRPEMLCTGNITRSRKRSKSVPSSRLIESPVETRNSSL